LAVQRGPGVPAVGLYKSRAGDSVKARREFTPQTDRVIATRFFKGAIETTHSIAPFLAIAVSVFCINTVFHVVLCQKEYLYKNPLIFNSCFIKFHPSRCSSTSNRTELGTQKNCKYRIKRLKVDKYVCYWRQVAGYYSNRRILNQRLHIPTMYHRQSITAKYHSKVSQQSITGKILWTLVLQ
jgi:hypothetical protein